MRPFLDSALKSFSELESKYKLMNQVYEEVLTLYGEDPVTTVSEEFFNVFKIFASSFEVSQNYLFLFSYYYFVFLLGSFGAMK